MQDFRAESYKKIASDKAKARAEEYSSGGQFQSKPGIIGSATSSVTAIKEGGSVQSGGTAKSSNYIYLPGVHGVAVGSRSIENAQNQASNASVSEVAQTKAEYQDFKNLQMQGVISQNARFVSSFEAQRNYFSQQMKAGGVAFSANAYNQFLRETKGAFPTQSQTIKGRIVSSPILFLNKGEVGFVFSSTEKDKNVYFSPLGRNLSSVMRGEKYEGFNKPIVEKQSFFKNYYDVEKGFFYDYPKSVIKGAVDTQMNAGAEIIKFASNPKERSSISGSAQAYFSGSVGSYANLYANNKDVQNFTNLYVSSVAGGVAGRAFGFGRGVFSGLAGRGIISQSAGRYALPSLGLYLTGKYAVGEVKSAYNVATTGSASDFGFFVASESANFASFTQGFKLGYGSSAFAKRELAINQASATAQKRVGFYTTKETKTYLAEGRGDVLFRYFDEGQGRTKSYRLDLRSKNVEYVRYIEEPKATFFYGTKGNPSQTFFSGVLLPSGKQFSSLKVEGGKYLVVDEVVKQGEILPKLTKGFFSRFEPSRRAEPLFSLFGKKFGNYQGDVLARDVFEFKNGNYVSLQRSRIPIINPIMALNPLTARTTSGKPVADLTIQSDISVSKGKFVNANGEYSFTQESYLRASTVKRGVSVETFGSTGVIDVATGKSFPSQIVIRQELPFYRFVDYTPKQKSLIYIEKKGGNIKARLPTESKVLQESSIVAKGFIGESASNTRLNIVRTVNIDSLKTSNSPVGRKLTLFEFKTLASKGRIGFYDTLAEKNPTGLFSELKSGNKIIYETVDKSLVSQAKKQGLSIISTKDSFGIKQNYIFSKSFSSEAKLKIGQLKKLDALIQGSKSISELINVEYEAGRVFNYENKDIFKFINQNFEKQDIISFLNNKRFENINIPIEDYGFKTTKTSYYGSNSLGINKKLPDKIVTEGFVNYGELLGQLRRGGGYLSKPTPESPEALGQFINLVEGNLKSSGSTKVIIEQVRVEVPVKSQSSSFEMSFAPSPQVQSPKSFGVLGLSRSASLSERGSNSKVYPQVRTNYGFSSYNLNSLSNINSLGLSNINSLSNTTVSRMSNSVINVNTTESRVSQVQERTQVSTQRQRQNTQTGFSRFNLGFKLKDPTPYIESPLVFGLVRFPKRSGKASSSKSKSKGRKKIKTGLRILPDLYSVNVTEGQTSRLFGKSSEAFVPKLTKSVRRSAGLAFGGFGYGLIPTEQIRTKRIKYPKFK